MWFRSEEDIDVLIAKGKLDKASKLLRERLNKNPESAQARQQLGDVLGRAGRRDEAIQVLAPLIHQFTQQGFSTKAIAVVKKIQRLDPNRSDIDRLIEKVKDQTDSAADAPPLISAHNSAYVQVSSDADELKSPRQVPAATSKVESDWLAKATARSNFHWSPILKDLSGLELSHAIRGVNLLTKHSGSIIYGRGDAADSLYILATGFARAFVRDTGDPYRQAAVIEEGQFFGEEAFFSPLRGRVTTVTAACDCELLELSLPVLHEILKEQHEVLDRLESAYRSRPWTLYEPTI